MKRVLCAGAALIGACATSTRVALPASLRDQAERYTVGGLVTLFQPKVRFGPYTMKGSSYGSGSHTDPTLFNGWSERDEDVQSGKFELPTASGTFHGRCQHAQATRSEHEKSLAYSSSGGWHIEDEAHVVGSTSILGCAIAMPRGGALRLQRRDDEQGTIEGGDVHWTFAPFASLDERPAIAAGLLSGFVIRDGGEVLGIVDPAPDGGSVTFARELDAERRDVFAAVAAALLLLR